MRGASHDFDDAEPVLIDLIDADPSVFGRAHAAATAEHADEAPADVPAERRAMPAWLLPGVGALVSALVVAVLVVTQPWHHRAAAPYSEQLVFDKPPAALEAAVIGADSIADTNGVGHTTGGAFYAEPGAMFQLTETSGGRWAAFIANVADPSSTSPDVTTADPNSGDTPVTLHGVTGVLHNSTPMQIDWTVGGLDYRAVAMGLSSDELLRFAAAASVQTGVASIDDPAALGAMKPLGSWDTYYHVARLLASLRPNAFLDVGTGTDSVSYGPFPSWSVASTVATSDDELAMLRFVLGKTTPATVHGNAAVTSDGTTFRMPQLAVVGWTERGRLILVAGPESAEKTIARAGTVREATLAEWAAVKQVAATNASPT